MKRIYGKNIKTNVFNGCPFKGSFYAIINNYTISDQTFPSFLPAGQYRSDLIISYGTLNGIILHMRAYMRALDYQLNN